MTDAKLSSRPVFYATTTITQTDVTKLGEPFFWCLPHSHIVNSKATPCLLHLTEGGYLTHGASLYQHREFLDKSFVCCCRVCNNGLGRRAVFGDYSECTFLLWVLRYGGLCYLAEGYLVSLTAFSIA